MQILGKKIKLRVINEDDLLMVMAWENNPEFRDITEHNGELSQEMVLNFIRNVAQQVSMPMFMATVRMRVMRFP